MGFQITLSWQRQTLDYGHGDADGLGRAQDRGFSLWCDGLPSALWRWLGRTWIGLVPRQVRDSVAEVAQAAFQSGAAETATGVHSTVWFVSMLPWTIIGTGLMLYLWIRYRKTSEGGT